MLRITVSLCAVVLLAAGVYAGIAGVLNRVLPFGVANAAVPAQINHQGVVSVNGVRYTGSGQFKFAIVNGSGVNQWTNDNTHIGEAGIPPDAVVVLGVIDGAYAVRLGDTSLSNMVAVPASIFSDGGLKLRVWFNDGINGVQQLLPDHTLATAPYAFTIADGAVTSAQIASQAVSSDKLAPDIGVWAKTGNDVNYTAGNVGVGLNNPSEALDVAGNARISGGLTVPGQSACRVYLNTVQSITHDVSTKIMFDSVSYDVNNEFSIANARFTATQAGLYYAHAAIDYGNPPNNQCYYQVQIWKNGAPYTYFMQASVSGYNFSIQAEDVIPLSASDYLEVYVYNCTNNVVAPNQLWTYFNVVKLH